MYVSIHDACSLIQTIYPSPTSVDTFSIVILREWPVNVARPLGIVCMQQADVLKAVEKGEGSCSNDPK